MAGSLLLKEVVVFLCIIEVLNADGDLLESIQLNAGNPPELNDFLRNVIQHKQVFSWIRHAARSAEEPQQEERNSYNDLQLQSNQYNKPGTYLKRNVRNRRPINDVHPYMYETDNVGNQKDSFSRPLRRKRRRQRAYPRARRSKGSVSLELSGEPDNGEVKVAPRSEAGVVDVPGEKYVGQHGIKRTCEDEYEVHEHLRMPPNRTKKGKTTTRESTDYYFSTPHDILGLDQDLSKEYTNLNGSCIQIKKSVRREDSAASHTSTTVKISSPTTFAATKTLGRLSQPIRQAPAVQTANQLYQQQQQQQQQAQRIQQLQQQPQQIQQPQVMQQRQSVPIIETQFRPQFVIPPQFVQNKSLSSLKGDFSNQKAQEFAKLMRYVDAPNMQTQTMTKQDLLRKDNDDVLENIDRVLKSDRSGLNLFRDVSYAPSVKRDEASKEAANQNHSSASDGNKVSVKRSPVARREKNSNSKRMNVELTLNALPHYNPAKKLSPKRRKVSFNKKSFKGGNQVKSPYCGDNNRNNINNNLPIKELPLESFPKLDQQTNEAQKQMLADPNLKIMENADDENNDNLKETLKEYINRQNEYNMGKQPEQEQDEEEITPDYQLVQEKKNMLEDQTEPTSAAEQRELGRKDPYSTPSLSAEFDTDNPLIVIPLKKDTGNSAIVNKNGEFDAGKEGFKVKEAKDVIHVRARPGAKNMVYKKEADQSGFDSSIFTKTVFNKVKDDIDDVERIELRDRNQYLGKNDKVKLTDYQNNLDYSYSNIIKEQNDKLDPGKESNSADYDNYENFDMKRDVSSLGGTNNFKSRKLNSLDYSAYEPKIRKKRSSADSEEKEEIDDIDDKTEFDKRSEDEEPDEEPGNDSKEPIEHEKKVQTPSKINEFSPKKEESEMTLHMDQSSDVKRNDTQNDFPPDDENDSFKSSNNNKSESATVINYNYFNITVNMISTSTDKSQDCEIGGSTGEADSMIPQPTARLDNINDQQLSANNEQQQANQLPHDILQFADNVKQKSSAQNVQNVEDTSTQGYIDRGPDSPDRVMVNEDKVKIGNSDKVANTDADGNGDKENEVKVYPKDTEDNEQDAKSSTSVDLNSIKHILTDDDEIEDKNVERSISENKRSDDNEDEERIREKAYTLHNAVDDAKHREMLVSKLEHLVNNYKSHIQNDAISDNIDAENIGKRSNNENIKEREAVHHYQHKKKVPTIPRPTCVSSLEKHVLKPQRTQFTKPREVYYEPESMADDLKEKLLFNKVYNRVVRKRKKSPDPFMYKIIDSVFGNDDESEDGMCPVNLDRDSNEAEKPSKRTDENEKESNNKEEFESNSEDSELDDVSRQKKKTKISEELLEKQEIANKGDEEEDSLSKSQPSNLIKKQTMEDSKMKLDNVDSFDDIIETPKQKALRKREVNRMNLEDFPNTYLSPINENRGDELRRKRRRLRYLHKPQKKVRQISYDDYVQQHGLGPKRLTNKEGGGGKPANFNKGQNSNIKQTGPKPTMAQPANNTGSAPQALKKAEGASNVVNPTVPPPKGAEYKTIEKNCTSELDDIKSNRSKMLECEVMKKEHEDMRRMLNGFLPIKLIDVFYERLKENPLLYNRFGGTIANSKECASENAHNIKQFREEQAKVDIKHAEEMLHEVIIMLNQIVADQVHRRTCLQLAPNLRIFVIRITKNLRNMKKNNQVAEGYPLPKIKSRSGDEMAIPAEADQGDFLFGNDEGERKMVSVDERTEVHRKIKLIEKLLDKYQSMSTKCQVEVEPVKDYLLQHLGMLMKMVDKQHSPVTCATTAKDEEPLVREDELAPPHGNITLKKLAKLGKTVEAKSTTPGNLATGAANVKLKGRADSEVSQRQHLMLLRHQQAEERQLREQEMLRQMQQEQQEQLSQAYSMQQGTYQQQVGQGVAGDALEQRNAPVYDGMATNLENLQNINSQVGEDHLQSRAASNPQQPASGPSTQNEPSMAVHNNGGNASSSNVGSNVAAIVQQELDPTGKHYTNPETVTKDLLQLGLAGASTYLPGFDLNGMVKENMIKSNIELNAKGELIPHLNTMPQPQKPPDKTGPKKRDIYGQELNDEHAEEGNSAANDEGSNYNLEEGIDKSVTSKNSGRVMSRNQELQDLIVTDMGSKPVFDQKRSAEHVANATQQTNQQPLTNNNAAKSNWNPSQIDYANYGKKQFIWQPLLIKATAIPDPDVEDTEYYTGHKYINPNLVNKDLQQLGLDGEINSYVMPFTLSSVVQAQIKAPPNVDAKFPVVKPATVLTRTRKEQDKSHYNVSEKYKRLLDTYHSMREKRQNEERIGKLYGAKTAVTKVDDLKTINKEMNDISKVSFEKPLVFSLEG